VPEITRENLGDYALAMLRILANIERNVAPGDTDPIDCDGVDCPTCPAYAPHSGGQCHFTILYDRLMKES
jgi:hypothetical protein